MKEINFELGHKMSEPSPMVVGMTTEKDEMMYPAFHYEGKEKLKLPAKEGTMLIRYRKTASSEREGDDHKHYSCTIEVQEIISVEGESNDEPETSPSREAEMSIDKMMAAKRKKAKSKSEDSEY